MQRVHLRPEVIAIGVRDNNLGEREGLQIGKRFRARKRIGPFGACGR
jgi:hypothetical protein